MILKNISAGKKYKRIISLVPSQTELLFYLGLGNEVIGITKFCIHPEEWFSDKIKIGGTKNIHIRKIEALVPDLIIANKEENIKEQIEELAKNFDIWVTDVNNLSDSLNMISDIGKLTAKEDAASALALQISNEFENLENLSSKKRKIRAAYFIWQNPYMVAGNDTFINDMMHYCGFQNVFSDKSRYPIITLQEIAESNCEIMILSSEPYPFKEIHKQEMQKIFPELKIILADGEMFSWYGSRLIKSAGYFQKNLHLY
jgi:ABC-type Fe3+-hydroxamate transport system substrate-binding protein